MEYQDFIQLSAANSSSFLPTSGKLQGNLLTTTDALPLLDTHSTQSGSLSTPMEAGIAEGEMEILDYSQSLHDEILDVFGGITQVAGKIVDSNQSLHDEVLDVFTGMTQVASQIVEYNQSLLESGLGESTPGDDPSLNPVLASAVTEAQKHLETFTTDKQFLDEMNLAFGENLPLQEAQGLIQNLASGKTLPDIEVLPAAELKGAEGAYGKETQTIYLSQGFLSENAAEPEVVADVLLEEIGHYVDQELGGGESRGDEGDIFSRLVQGETLSAEELEKIKQENDKGTISPPGEKEPVEQADSTYPLDEPLKYDPSAPDEYDEDPNVVMQWQQYMVDEGYLKGKVDGLYGLESDAATRQFQADQGLEEDGDVGPLTWEAAFGTEEPPAPPPSEGGTPDPLFPEYSGEMTESSELSPNMKAFLDTIAWAEGTYQPEGYRIIVGYIDEIDSFEDHPRVLNEELNSTAAGRYQFIEGTWDGLGLPDFSPVNQDLGAVQLIDQQGAVDDVEAGNFEEAVYAVNNVWASFPGSPYGQPTKTLEELQAFYDQRLPAYDVA